MEFLLWTGAELLVWMEGELLLSAALVAMLLVPAATCWWQARRVAGVRLTHAGRTSWAPGVRLQGVDRIEDRLAHLCTAVSLLTDSTESGLRDAIAEIERLSKAAGGGAVVRPAARQRRVQTAATHGQTAREIALAEGVSEGEVRLRLRLQDGDQRQASAQSGVQ